MKRNKYSLATLLILFYLSLNARTHEPTVKMDVGIVQNFLGLVSAAYHGNDVIIAYNKPVNQSMITAYAVTGLSNIGISGNGDN